MRGIWESGRPRPRMPPNPINHLERAGFSCSLEFLRRALAKRSHAEIDGARTKAFKQTGRLLACYDCCCKDNGPLSSLSPKKQQTQRYGGHERPNTQRVPLLVSPSSSKQTSDS